MAVIVQNIILNNTTYSKIVGEIGYEKRIYPSAKDLNGNTFNRVTLEIDSSNGKVAVFLPDIPTLADNLIMEIIVISVAGSTVSASLGQFLGVDPETEVKGVGVFRTISENRWAYYKC